MPRHAPISFKHTTISEQTLLRAWMDENDKSAFALARLLRVDPKTVIALAAGRQLPSLVLAFKVEQVTAGAVPASSWLGTELGRMRYNATTFDWTGWTAAKAEATARHDARRSSTKTPKARRTDAPEA